MGLYINPYDDNDGREKAQKIDAVGAPVSREEFREHIPGQDNDWGVAVIDNGLFIAAGIAFNKQEADAFASINDGRTVRYYIVLFDDIAELDKYAAKLLKNYIKE